MKRIYKAFIKVTLGTVLGLGLLYLAVFGYARWKDGRAKSNAEQFCALTLSGASANAVLERIQKNVPAPDTTANNIEQASNITLMWQGFIMNRWYCSISFDNEYRVAEKHSGILD